jgi:hypothetical protein
VRPMPTSARSFWRRARVAWTDKGQQGQYDGGAVTDEAMHGGRLQNRCVGCGAVLPVPTFCAAVAHAMPTLPFMPINLGWLSLRGVMVFLSRR